MANGIVISPVSPGRPDLSNAVRTRLAAAAGCDLSTVNRWRRGAPVRSTTRARLEAAAEALHLDAPSGPEAA